MLNMLFSYARCDQVGMDLCLNIYRLFDQILKLKLILFSFKYFSCLEQNYFSSISG